MRVYIKGIHLSRVFLHHDVVERLIIACTESCQVIREHLAAGAGSVDVRIAVPFHVADIELIGDNILAWTSGLPSGDCGPYIYPLVEIEAGNGWIVQKDGLEDVWSAQDNSASIGGNVKA
jgi:hypothetical protein